MMLLGNAVIITGLLSMLCGIVGLLRFRTFYRRIVIGSLLDTAGLLLLLSGLAMRQGLTTFSLKLWLLLAVVFLTAPLITHKIGRCAYLSGYREEDAP